MDSNGFETEMEIHLHEENARLRRALLLVETGAAPWCASPRRAETFTITKYHMDQVRAALRPRATPDAGRRP